MLQGDMPFSQLAQLPPTPWHVPPSPLPPPYVPYLHVPMPQPTPQLPTPKPPPAPAPPAQPTPALPQPTPPCVQPAPPLPTALAHMASVVSGATELSPGQCHRSPVYAARTTAQASAAQVLSGVSQSTWIVLAFYHFLRRRAEESGSAIHRRVMATVRERVLTLRASPPRALKSFDVGVTDRLSLVYRNSSGKLSDEHPACDNKALIRDGTALTADGQCVEPQLPPPDSPYELCPDASGGICYLNRALGTAQWDPPPGSTPLQPSAFVDAPAFSSPPPLYPFVMGLNALRGTRWEPIFEDADSRVRLYNVDTGSVRDAPWISLRTPEGCVFFANLVSHETRWFPPHT
mmetsp:Transcript_2560/g.8144  ORF Transcript_2560/g.8144 Transcript_2560/m.8144 type:complete len:347 (-) Transcript_2560:968-2008(-)